VDAIYLDHDEWKQPWTRGAAILHIELRRWAHDLYIVPLSANTLAKLAWGMSDNLLTSVVRAWEVLPAQPEAPAGKPPRQTELQKLVYLAPAMNTAMWLHPATKDHLSTIERYGRREGADPWMEVIPPQVKELACGDTGTGAMRDWEFILGHIEKNIENHEFYP
jgi:phosphopantothenoylcysteine decarboxylase